MRGVYCATNTVLNAVVGTELINIVPHNLNRVEILSATIWTSNPRCIFVCGFAPSGYTTDAVDSLAVCDSGTPAISDVDALAGVWQADSPTLVLNGHLWHVAASCLGVCRIRTLRMCRRVGHRNSSDANGISLYVKSITRATDLTSAVYFRV